MQSSEPVIGFGISAVERDSGISKDTLRMWERRYGFPSPARDQFGERIYLPQDMEKLRLMKRLMDRGHRPGKLIGLGVEALAQLAAAPAAVEPPPVTGSNFNEFLRRLKDHDMQGLRNFLAQALMQQGLRAFVHDTVAPLNAAIGRGWESGSIEVFEEHLYTEQMQRILRGAIMNLPAHHPVPKILLTTLPGEQHELGLLMAEAVLAVEGAHCVSLGVEMPVPDTVQAALRHGAHVVGLSFSIAFPAAAVTEGLNNLRSTLPASIAIWAGGQGAGHVKRPIAGVQLIPDLTTLVECFKAWPGEPTR